jgi:hypothetical protein
LSIPYPDGPDGAPSRGLVLLRSVAVIAAIVSVSSLWFSERTRVIDDLQLSAEATARPGEELALRAFYLRDVDAARGPSLEVTPVSVKLLDPQGREVARATLQPARGDPSLEGSIQIPTHARGAWVLEARAAPPDRTPLLARRGLQVFPEAPRLVPRPRQASPLQQQALGPLRSLQAAGEALALLPRVLGGACVPEQLCTLLVWVGEPGARIELRHDGAVSIEGAARPALETSGFVEIALRVHGPEATLTLEARRGEALAAERSLRLPVALGEASLSVGHSLVEPRRPVELGVHLPPGRARGIVDVFLVGRWRATLAFTQPGEGARLSLPGRWFLPGLVRLQAHADRFGGEGAGTRVIYVRAPGETLERSLQQLAAAVHAQGQAEDAADAAPPARGGPRSTQAPWAFQLPEAARAQPQLAAAFLLAELEQLRVPLPRAASGRPRELQRLSRAQTYLRFGVGALLVLSALIVGMTLMRRGLRADAEARAILDEAEREAGDAPDLPAPRHEPGPGTLFVVWLVLLVGLAFVAAALLIVAKPLWF